jgi:hypothetical protein
MLQLLWRYIEIMLELHLSSLGVTLEQRRFTLELGYSYVKFMLD